MEKLIEERRLQFQREKEEELEERKAEEAAMRERRVIIEQERQRLLREHANKLLGYLPKVGTIYPCLMPCLERSKYSSVLSWCPKC